MFLKQKSRISWLNLGDSNSGFFCKSCRLRWNINKILSLEDRNGNLCTSHSAISQEAVSYYSELFGSTGQVLEIPDDISLPSLSSVQHDLLMRPYSAEDVLKVVRSMPSNKSPGPDGFTKEFFLAAWSIVGADFTNAVLYFFRTNNLPRIISASAITLVPKHKNANKMVDFRPIACCNFVYKCISKLIANRLKLVIPYLISANQSAFVSKRLIGDNIFLAQSLFRGYHLDSGPARCSMKLDITKAFDSVNWSFLFAVLNKMNFPVMFQNWVKTCVQSCMISVKINGSLEGFFKASAGLRQGDPISPYLFVICMEVLSVYLSKLENSSAFKFHWKCKASSITHLMFADDVLLFCNGDIESVKALLSAVQSFQDVSGLVINKNKSLIFLSSVRDDELAAIINASGLQRGTLPVKYLGLPLITSKLSARDCSPLIMRIRDQIDCWASSCLNHAGRLQLLKSVLFGIQAHWSNHLFLPKHILKCVQSYFLRFLWGGSTSSNKQVKVSWSECCKSLDEGGLGIKDPLQWNKAAFLFQLWPLINANRRSSLWIDWVHNTWLRNKSIWTFSVPASASWCLKKMLLLRHIALRFLNYSVGKQSSFYFWHDPWIDNVPLLQKYDPILVSIMESSRMAKISDFISNDSWALPASNHLWAVEVKRKVLQVPLADSDIIHWQAFSFNDVKVATIWHSIRPPESSPPWINAVWHPLRIHKCSFIFWLALKDRLLTKERMDLFGMTTDLRCCFCSNAIETVSHLFGSCAFATSIISDPYFALVGDWSCYQNGIFTTGSRSSLMKRHMTYLFLAVSVYFIWKERNERVHTPGHALSPSTIRINVKRTIREKLCSNEGFKKAAAKDRSLILALY